MHASVSLCTAASCFLPKTLDVESTGRKSKGGGKEATEGDGGVLGRHPPAAHGVLHQDSPSIRKPFGDPLLCQTHAHPQNEVRCTPLGSPTLQCTHLISQGQETGTRPLHQASTCGITAVNKTDANKVPFFFFTEMEKQTGGSNLKQEAQT